MPLSLTGQSIHSLIIYSCEKILAKRDRAGAIQPPLLISVALTTKFNHIFLELNLIAVISIAA
ncbi:MAG: hypothetical protein RIM23_20275 [Coleofasciculus sp. G3-WIS-01]|uniref:hypothetical protein n=1 Tax=Coleofasciculus sp. G3-WIS-01 TaxID=3069528 RepID=UPI0032FDDDA6